LPPHRRSARAAALLTVAAIAAAAPAGARAEQESQLKTVRHVVLRVTRGRMHVPRREVKSAMKTRGSGPWPWSPHPPLRLDFLHADTLGIAAVYRQHGFLDVQVSDTVRAAGTGEVDILFRIREGPRSHITDVRFEGARAVREDDLRHNLYARPGRPFDPAYLIADTALISRAYQQRGFLPHVVGAAERDSIQPLRIHVVEFVNEGPRYQVGQTYVVRPGEPRVKERLIRRELLLKPGSTYDIRRVEDSQQRLYDTGLFSQVQITPLPDSSNTQIEFFVQLRERRPRWLDAGVGSGTAERFQLTSEWGHRNLAGRGLQGVLGARYALGSDGRFLLGRGEASLLEPWLFGTRNRGQTTVYLERHRFETDTLRLVKDARGVSFEVRRDFGRLTHIRLVQDNTFVKQRQTIKIALAQAVADSLDSAFVSSYATHRLQLSGERDRRDSPVNPLHGSLQDVAGEVAGGPFHATTHFTKFQFSSSWYTPTPLGGWMLATHARGGVIRPFGPPANVNPTAGVEPEVSRVPIEDLFRLGGVNSVRGYDENDIGRSGGLATLLGNIELRAPLVGPFGVELYIDAGNVWALPKYVTWRDFALRPHQTLDPRNVRYVYGVGGRFNLPFGPLRLDVTQGIGDDPLRRPIRHVQFAIGPSF
jgi:outer membrane protein assembly complex protein YaeT